MKSKILEKNTFSKIPYDGGRLERGIIPIQPGSPWSRNRHWLDMPSFSPTEDKICILYAVYPSSSYFFCPLDIEPNDGVYIDYGNGESFTGSATFALKQYSWTDSALDDTDIVVTFDSSSNTVNRTSHGYSDGETVQFYYITGPTTSSLFENNSYYVISASSDSFKVSEMSGGSPITFDSHGTGSLLPYKQAIVTIIPSGSGEYIDRSDVVTQFHPSASGDSPELQYLDFHISAVSASYVKFGDSSGNELNMLENITFHSHDMPFLTNIFCTYLYNLYRCNTPTGSNSITTLADFSRNCYRLEHVPPLDTSNVTNFSFALSFTNIKEFNDDWDFSSATILTFLFSSCPNLTKIKMTKTSGTGVTLQQLANATVSLKDVDLTNFKGANNCNAAFSACPSLEKTPWFDTSNVTNFSSMFYNDISLKEVVSYDYSSATNLSSMFGLCESLEQIPELKLININDVGNMFDSCFSLKYAKLDLRGCSLVDNIFSENHSLAYAHIIVNDSASTFVNLFENCDSLKEVTIEGDTSNVTSMYGMFNGCNSLTKINGMNEITSTNSVQSYQYMFASCYRITEIPILFNMDGVTNSSYMFNFARSVKHLYFTGSATSNVSLASMFATCYNLEYISGLNTSHSSAPTISNMFQNCHVLKHIPPGIDFSKATNFSSVFNGCYLLIDTPDQDVSAASSLTNTFGNCYNLQEVNFTNIDVSCNFSDCNLSGPALDKLYTNLASVGSATIVVTGNPGIPDSDPSIATAKGWTVTE